LPPVAGDEGSRRAPILIVFSSACGGYSARRALILKNEGDFQIHPVFVDLAILDDAFLVGHPDAFHILQRLDRARNANLDGVFKALFGRGDKFGHASDGHEILPGKLKYLETDLLDRRLE
jgi:hypothetical protein